MPKSSSVYEVVYEEPAPAPNARSGGQLFNMLNQIVTDNKEAWAKVVECNSRSGANSILNRINKGKTNLPAPRECFKFTCRTDSPTNKSWLYALYAKNGFPEDTPAAPAAPAKKVNPKPRKRAAAST